MVTALRVCGAGTGPHLADTEGGEERAGEREGEDPHRRSLLRRQHSARIQSRRRVPNPPHPTALVLGATPLEWFRRVDKRGEGGARGAEIGGESRVPGPLRLPRHPLTP